MTSLTPNTVYLTGVSYLPEKREVITEFSNSGEKITRKFQFFPSITLSIEGIRKDVFESIISLYNGKKIKLQYLNGDRVRIIGATFSDLKKLRNLVSSSLKLPVLLLEPERQFLIERDWSYFDSFELVGGRLERKEGFKLPNITPSFLPDSLPVVIVELIGSDYASAEKLVERVGLSNILSIRLQEVPQNKPLQVELLLEKIFFKNNLPIVQEKNRQYFQSSKSRPRGVFGNLAELGFSSTFCTLLTFPFFNIGFDTLNCRCCKPGSVNADNLAPNSLINVRFLLDGIYFESRFSSWSANFHRTMPGKESRLNQKREWFLSSTPVGPFYKGQRLRVPLVDLMPLLEKKHLAIEEEGHELIWFCRKMESALSKSIKKLNRKINYLKRSFTEREKNSLKKHNILFSESLSQDIDYFSETTFHNLLLNLLNYIPTHMLSPKSKFYSSKIADAISCTQSEIIYKFRQFSAKKGCKSIDMNKHKVFVESDSVLSLAKEFSTQYSLPVPEIVAVEKAASF